MLSTAARLIDRGMDFTVLPGYTKLGVGLRSRFWDDEAGAGLEGKRVLLTGASSGLGEAAAEMIAAAGAELHMLVRNEEKGRAVADEIAARTGVEAPAIEVCDVSSLAGIREFAAGFRQRHDDLDVLINNAGVMPPKRAHTPEGFELTFATNALGPYLLTSLLLDQLRAGGSGRVIDVSSGGMYSERLRPDDLQLEMRDYDPPAFYAHTKRIQVIVAEVFAEREADQAAGGVSFHSMHPGWADTPGVEDSLPNFHKLLKPLLRDPAEGADTIVWLSGADAGEIGTGGFWHDRQRRPTHRLPSTRESESDRQSLWGQMRALSGLD